MPTELQKQQRSPVSLRALIVGTIKQKHPATVGDLANLLMTEGAVDEADLVETIQAMVEDGSLNLAKAQYDLESVLDYLLTPTLSGWFWSVMGLTVLAVGGVFITPDLFPLTIARWTFGSILILYLPGYSLVESLFPTQTALGSLERFTFSVALSLCVDILLGLLVNSLPGSQLRLEPIVASLSGFTVIFATVALGRKYSGLQRSAISSL